MVWREGHTAQVNGIRWLLECLCKCPTGGQGELHQRSGEAGGPDSAGEVFSGSVSCSWRVGAKRQTSSGVIDRRSAKAECHLRIFRHFVILSESKRQVVILPAKQIESRLAVEVMVRTEPD